MDADMVASVRKQFQALDLDGDGRYSLKKIKLNLVFFQDWQINSQ